MDRSTVVVPLLNHYKYGLLRRRLIQTVLGGPRIRRVPWYIHVIQIGLLLVPLALSIPFIVIDGLRLWNQYLIALLYGITMALFDLVQGVIVALIRWRHQRNNFEVVEIDDEEDSVEISSCLGAETVEFIFSRKRLISIVFGWFTMCTAHYSLSVRAPPEAAFYRPTDPLELKFLYRSFYIVLLGCIYIPLRYNEMNESVSVVLCGFIFSDCMYLQ